jgi:HAD superfamily hydrolase (TIGR01509 family)
VAEYDAWLVDLDGTLYVARWVKLLMGIELALSGWSAVRTLRQFRHEHERLRERQAAGEQLVSSAGSPFAEQLASTALALELSVSQVEGIVQEWMFERPRKWIGHFPRRGLLAELRSFKAAGGRTALVSDYPAQRKMQALGADGLFDVVIANGEANGPRRLKPDPEGYLRAAELLTVPAARCLVIGDRKDADGEAARAAHMGFRLV